MSFIQRLIKNLFDDANVGPHRPPGSSPIQRQGERVEVARVVIVDYEAIEKKMEGLKVDVTDASVNDPYGYRSPPTFSNWLKIVF